MVKKFLAVLSIIMLCIASINAVDVIDYETGECVSLCPCQSLVSKYSPPASIVDWQSLATESAVTVSRDSTYSASLWEHGPIWARG
jgi:hypothetical protein